MQQRARQERLNNSRKWKCVDHTKLLPVKEDEDCKTGNLDVLHCENCIEETSEIIGLDDDDKEVTSRDGQSENISNNGKNSEESCLCVIAEHSDVNKGNADECCERDESLASIQNDSGEEDEDSLSEIKTYSKSKRHSDKDLDNPKPCKSRRAINNSALLSRKYSSLSFCGIEDRLPDGFYDAGRDRPFTPLRDYDKSFPLGSREVIVLDRLIYSCTLC